MVKNKDKWSALSMTERADLINTYIQNGVNSLKEMREHYNGIPYRDFNTSNYDYFGAHPDNAPTKEEEHWTSRNPVTGQLLKREDHPTYNLMIEGEKKAGYNIYKGLDGNLYSKPNEPTNYVEYNSFGDGGPTEEGGYSKESLQHRKDIHASYDPTNRINAIDQIIVAATGGNNAKGEEDQYWRAYLGLTNDVPKMNSNAKTSWDDEVEQQKINSGELPSDFYGTTSRMDLNIQAIADTLNTGKIYRDYNKYKTMYPKLPAKWIVEEIYNTGKRVLENPNEWQQVDGDNTAIKRGLDISTNEVNPLGMLANFGMMWNPEEKAIYIHDTYDFPKTSRLLVGDRPKEMKIRSKISFDPKKGSKLLRDNMKNFFDYPEPISEK